MIIFWGVLGVFASTALPVTWTPRRSKITWRCADPQRQRGRADLLPGGGSALPGTELSTHPLPDEIIGLLFEAGLSLDRLAARLSDAQDKRLLDAAVQNLDGVVRNVRLLSLCHRRAD